VEKYSNCKRIISKAIEKFGGIDILVNNAGVWVNCIVPGWVATDMTSSILKKRVYNSKIYSDTPRGKPVSQEEIAGPIFFLAFNFSNNIVGEIINVNGGSVLCG
jgi:3-oxoacyl-[acyl-carrier protein] reductase